MTDLFDCPRAFAPFFTDAVAYSGKRSGGRTVRTTFMACVIDDGYDEMISDSGVTESRIRRISVTIPRVDRGWKDHGIVPQVGDELTLEHGVTFAVSQVNDLDRNHWQLQARQM